MDIWKNFQQCTRQMQSLSAHGKTTGLAAMAKEAPMMKKALEVLLYEVKAAIKTHVPTMTKDAFIIGTLKNRNVDGSVSAAVEVVTEPAPPTPQEQEDEGGDDDEEEDDREREQEEDEEEERGEEEEEHIVRNGWRGMYERREEGKGDRQMTEKAEPRQMNETSHTQH